MRVDKRLQRFDQERCALLEEMERLGPAQLTARPLPEKWSILEIIEHLVIAERAILRGLPEPTRLVELERKRRFKHRLAYLVVMFILRFGIPVKVPSRRMNPRGDRTLVELRRLWEENQAWLKTYISSLDRRGFRRAVFEHPVSGPMTVGQAIHMDQYHLNSHTRQIRRLQRLLR